MDFDASLAVEPPSPFDPALAVSPPVPTMGEVVGSVPRSVRGSLAQALGGGVRVAGDVVKGITGYGGISDVGAGIAESGVLEQQDAAPKNMSFAQEAVHAGLTSTGVMVPAMLAYPLTGIPGLLTIMGSTTAGQTYHTAREAGFAPARSLVHSVFEGGVEAATELLPARALFGRSKNYLTRFVNLLSKDVPGELVATALQDASAKLSYRPDMTAEEFMHDMLLTVASVAVSTPIQAGIAQGGMAIAERLPGGDQLNQPAATPPAIPPQNPQAVPPVTPTDTTAQQFSAASAASPDLSIEAMRQLLMSSPPTAEDTVKAEAVDEGLKLVSKAIQERGEEPDVINSEWVAGHMRTKYPEQNKANLTPPGQLPVLYRGGEQVSPAMVDGQPAMTLSQVDVKPGEVVTVGFPDEKRPSEVLGLMHQTMQDWVTKFAPTAKVVITTRDTFNTAVVAQTQFKDGYAFVSPPHFYASMINRMLDTSTYPDGIDEFSAQSKAIFALSHEFGRILTETSFREAPTEVKNELVAKWESLRARVESGEMSAQEFLQRWLNPWKIARGQKATAPGKEVDRFIQTVMFGENADMTKDVKGVLAKDFVRKLVDRGDGNVEQVLSFQSFMAEQTARHFHARKIADASPLGQFFAKTIARMREFFDYLFSSGQMQYTKAIEAEPAFAKWMDSMAAGQSVVASTAKKAEAKKKKTKTKQTKAKPKNEPVQPTVTDPMKEVKRLRALAIQLKKDSPEEYARIMQLIKEQDYTGAQEALNDFFDEDGKPKFELDDPTSLDFTSKGFEPVSRVGLTEAESKRPDVLAYARRLAKEMGGMEYTPMFKSWAGDWELFNLWQQRQVVQSQLLTGGPTDVVAKKEELVDIKLKMRTLQHRYANLQRGTVPSPFLRIFQDAETNAKDTLELNTRPKVTAVLDANGRPKVVYHGTGTRATTPEGILQFDPKLRGESTGAPSAELAFFFAGDTFTAEVFAQDPGEPDMIFETAADRQTYETLMAQAKQLRDKRDTIVSAAKALQLLTPRYGDILWLEAKGKKDALLSRGQQLLDRALELETEASHYPKYDYPPPTMYPVYLSMQNPLEFDDKGDTYRTESYFDRLQQAIAGGYDGVIIYNTFDGGPMTTIYAVFHPQQVKSYRGNAGTYAKTNELHFELGDETEAAQKNIADAIPEESDVDILQLGEGMRNISRWQLATLQTQQLASLNPAIPGLQYFNRVRLFYEQLRKSLMAKGVEVAHNWRSLMKEARSQLDRALTAEYQGEQHWTNLERDLQGNWIHVPSETLKVKLESMGIDTNSERGKMVAQLFIDTKNIHLMQLQMFEKVLYDRLAKRYKDRTVLAVKAQQLFQTVEAIRNVPFLPQSRFGKYSIVISEPQPTGPAKPVHIEYFENKKERDKAYKKLHSSAVANGKRIVAHDLSDNISIMPSIPQTYIDTVAEILKLSDEDVLAMQMAAQAVKGKAVFGKYDKEFRKITGASKDMQRNFVDHVWHTANMLAKLKYRPEFNRATTMLTRQIRELHENNQFSAPLQNLQKWMEIQRDYILNPQSELQKLRTAITLLALWGSVKTAAMNATSMVNTWSVLINQFGTKAATEEILRAIKDEAQAMYTTTQFSAADKRLREMLNIEGITDQSYAYMLAEMANSGALRRAFAHSKAGLAWDTFKHVGMLPFRIVEIYSRRVGALAAARLMIQQGASVEAAHDFASQQVLLTQGDYSPGNRPRFMQGKKSIAMIFLLFVQTMTFLMGGGAGAAAAARLWVFYGMLGGILGLPAMENLMDILKMVWRKGLGQDEDPKMELHKFLNEITGGNGQTLMHGILHNMGGFDLSRSISLGRLVPGTDVLAGEGDLNFKFTNMAADMTGPFGGTIQGVLQFLTGTDPNWARRAAYALPGTTRSLLQTHLFANEGVRGSGGHIITRDRDGTIRDLTGYELMGRALGFQPAIVSQNREIDREQREMQRYWSRRRESVLRTMWEAKIQNDREALADAKESVQRFNEKAPEKSLRISERDVQQSMRQRQKILERDQAGLAPSRRYDPMYRELEQALLGL